MPDETPDDATSSPSPASGGLVRVEKQELNFREVGTTGLERSGGEVLEEPLRALRGRRGRKVFREMAWNDDVVGSVLFAVEMLIRQVEWRWEAADNTQEARRAADFMAGVVQDMSLSWEDTLAEILSMLPFGWSALEIVYKRRQGTDRRPGLASRFDDGRVGWRKLAIRSQDALERWVFDDEGGIDGAVFRDPNLAAGNKSIYSLPIEKILLFRIRSWRGSPEGLSVLRNAYRCYDEETEILTDEGFKGVGEVTGEDMVATLNPDTDEIEYHRPTRTYSYDYDGELYAQGGRFVDLLVTPNHNMWVKRDHKDAFEFIEARDTPKQATYRRGGGTWEGVDRDCFRLPAVEYTQRIRSGTDQYADLRTFTIPERTIPMDSWLKFFGFWVAEGSAHHHVRDDGTKKSSCTVTQNEGETADWFRGVLDECDFGGWYEKRSGEEKKVTFEKTSLQLHSYLSQFGKAGEKYIPEELKELSARQLRVLLDAMWRGDGTISGRGATVGEYGPYEGTRRIYTVSEALADDIHEIALKAGLSPITGRYEDHDARYGNRDIYWVSLSDQENTRVNTKSDNREMVPYQGKVHCVEVPNHIVYVRRNGKGCWSGNSWWFKKRIQEIEAIGIERDLAGLPVAWVPPEWLGDDATSEDKASLSTVKEMIRNVRRDEQEGIVMPLAYDENSNKMIDLSLITSGGSRQFETDEIITRYDRAIASSMLADFILLGHESVGSFALVADKSTMFSVALGAFMDAIAGVFNRHAVPRLWRLNGFPEDTMPRLVHGQVERVDLEELGNYITALAGAGAPLFPDDRLESWLRQVASMPQKEETDTAL